MKRGTYASERNFLNTKKQFLCVSVALLALGLNGCGDKETVVKAAKDTTVAPLELAAVDVITVSSAAARGGLAITGTLQPVRLTTVQSRVASEVNAVNVREGEHVQKGQVLASLAVQDLEARLKQTQANLAAAKTQATLSRALVERNKSLYEKKYFSEIDYQRSVAEADARDADMRAQQALVDISRKAFNDASIRAPMSGIVARRYIEPGNSVNVDGKLFDIVDLAEMEISAPVAATDIAAVKVGQAVNFTVSGFGERKFSGKVVRINPVADTGSRAISVYVRVNNSTSDLKGGMYIRGNVVSSAVGTGLSISRDAVHDGASSTPWVLVLKNEKLEKRLVQLGVQDEHSDEIFLQAGVVPGERVIVAKLLDNVINQPARISQ
jgi:RND family efflux transporter MFP subunit